MSRHTKPQPKPKNATDRAVWPLVVRDVVEAAVLSDVPITVERAVLADMQARDAQGREKYGVPLVADNWRDHAVDAYQEALDGCAYWKAEALKTGSEDANTLYRSALEHALGCRRYLLERDGR